MVVVFAFCISGDLTSIRLALMAWAKISAELPVDMVQYLQRRCVVVKLFSCSAVPSSAQGHVAGRNTAVCGSLEPPHQRVGPGGAGGPHTSARRQFETNQQDGTAVDRQEILWLSWETRDSCGDKDHTFPCLDTHSRGQATQLVVSTRPESCTSAGYALHDQGMLRGRGRLPP